MPSAYIRIHNREDGIRSLQCLDELVLEGFWNKNIVRSDAGLAGINDLTP